jgi:hypothetical protein
MTEIVITATPGGTDPNIIITSANPQQSSTVQIVPAPGRRGEQGPAGPQGDPGPQGEPGPQAEDSATETLGAFGNNATVITGLESEIVLDSFDSQIWRNVTYSVTLSAEQHNKFYSTEMKVLVDNDGVSVMEYSSLDNDGDVGTINVSKSGSIVSLSVLPNLITQPITARFYRTGLKA